MNYFKGLIKTHEKTQADIAKCLGCTRVTAMKKANNPHSFTYGETVKIADCLGCDVGKIIDSIINTREGK